MLIEIRVVGFSRSPFVLRPWLGFEAVQTIFAFEVRPALQVSSISIRI